MPWVPLCLGLLALVLHARELLGSVPFARDTHLIFVPARHFLAERLARGELPQWWPWDGAGAPFLAQPIFSTFHPFAALYAFLPFWPAFVLEEVLVSFGAMLGAYALCRSLRQPRSAAFVAATAYGLGGYLVGLTEFLFSKLSAAALPWYAAALVVAARRRGGWLVAPTVAMALALLGGDPQIALLAAMFGAALLLIAQRPSALRCGLALASPLGEALLAAVQLVPSMLVAGETERGAPMAYANAWALELRHLAGLVAPLSHGAWDFVASTYVGPAALLLAAAAFFGPRRRLCWTLLGVSLVSVWLALGDGAGLNAAARRFVPFWSQFRYPIKSVLLLFVCVPVLAGEGLRVLSRLRRQTVASRLALATMALVLLGLASLVTSVDPIWLAGALATTVVVLLSRSVPHASAVSAVLIAAHALTVTLPIRPLIDREFFGPSPLATTMRSAGISLQGPAFDRIDTALRSPADWARACRAGGGGDGSSFGALVGLPTLTPSTAGSSGRIRRLFAEHSAELASRLAGVYGVGFLVLNGPLQPRLAAQRIGGDDAFGYSLVRLRNHLPRAYLVHRARVARNADEALRMVTAPDFKPGREVVVESADDRLDWESRPDQPALEVPITAREGDSLSLAVDAPWPGFLVLNEAAFSGWTASVDDAPARLLTANFAVRGVEVPQGRHRIAFEFHTPGLELGALLSLGSLVLCLLLGLAAHRTAVRHRSAAHAG